MVKYFLLFFKTNKRLLKNYINRKEPNKLTGLSLYNKKKLLDLDRYKEGNIYLFNNLFHFSDNLGFLHSLEEIFEDEVYRFKSKNNAPFIIDCGANIGLSLLYFKKKYPNSKIIAFEPDKRIFKILKKNIDTFFNNKNIDVREEAVWVKDTELIFFSEGSLAGSVSVDFSDKNNKQKVKAIDFKKYLNTKVDFLKIDIEGAENQLIFDIKDHLKNVENLFIEYHGLIDKKQNLGDILNLLTSCGFEYYIRLAGETMKYPFCGEKPQKFNQQLNILCYRK